MIMPPISRHFNFRFLVLEVVLTMRPLSKLRTVFESILVFKLRRMMIVLDDKEEASSSAKVSWGLLTKL